MIRLFLALALLAAYPMAQAFAQDTKSAAIMPPPVPEPHDTLLRQITVSGDCIRQVTPDRGIVTATANYIDPKSVANASKTVMAQYEKFRTAVEALGLKDLTIQTSDYSVQPIYTWVQPNPQQAGKQVLQGYQARLGLSVKTSSLDKLGDVIAKAAEIGIQEVGGFQLAVSTELDRKLRAECLTEAVASAKTKAERMATAAGEKLGRTLMISENFMGPVMPMMARGMEMKAMAIASDGSSMPTPSIQPGQTTLQVTIQAAFEMK